MNNLQELQEELQAASSEREKLQIIIAYGEELERVEENNFTLSDKVPGCASDVYVKAKEENGKIYFTGYANSLIIKGYLAILLDVMNEKTRIELEQMEDMITIFINSTGIATISTTPSRTNSFARLFEFMKEKSK